MKKFLLLTLALSWIAFQASARDAQTEAWVQFFSGYYRAPEATSLGYSKQLGSWEDAATLLYLSKLTGIKPELILGWRVGEKAPWIAIFGRLKIPETILDLPEVRQGPPYGKAWGYWHRSAHARSQGTVILSDAEVRDRILLKVVTRHYGLAEPEVMTRVGNGTPFRSLILTQEQKLGHVPAGLAGKGWKKTPPGLQKKGGIPPGQGKKS